MMGDKESTEILTLADDTTIVPQVNQARYEYLKTTATRIIPYEFTRASYTAQVLTLLSILFKDKYTITQTLSASFDKSTYVLKAKEKKSGDDKVIKALVTQSFYSPQDIEIKKKRFRAEADITYGLGSMLHGQGVVKVTDTGTKYPTRYPAFQRAVRKGRFPVAIPYFVTEYVGGGDLEKLTITNVSLKERITVARKIAEPLAFIHENYNLVHRDIKPSNVVLTKNNEPKIIDFGTYEVIGKREMKTEAGTIPYFSPTQAAGAIAAREGKTMPEHTPRTDIYTLALVLGDIQFWDHPKNPVQQIECKYKTEIAYCEYIASDPAIEFPSSGNAEFDDILHRAVSNKSDRFKSMKEFAKALLALECKL
ncbi:MAG: protein kinase [Candidatus Woesearchaeota archaeon]